MRFLKIFFHLVKTKALSLRFLKIFFHPVKELVTTISGLIPWGGAGDKHFWH